MSAPKRVIIFLEGTDPLAILMNEKANGLFTQLQNFDGAKYFTGDLALKKGDRYVRASLEFKSQSNSAKLTVVIWGSNSLTDKKCLAMSVYEGSSKCLRSAL